MTDPSRTFDNTETDRIDAKARAVAARWAAGEVDEASTRKELLRLALDGPVLVSCVRQQAPSPTPQSRSDMHDWMVDLLEHKVVNDPPGPTPLDLRRIVDGDALTGWVRRTLTGAGPYLRHRIARAEHQRLQRIARVARSVEGEGSQMAWAAPETGPEDVLLADTEDVVDEPAGVDVEVVDGDVTRAMLLADGREVAARAAAFRAKGSSFRGHRRLNAQVALAAQMMELDPPSRLPLSRWADRVEIGDWCREHSDGVRLRRLLSLRRNGRADEETTPTEEKVLELFDGYTLAQAAALTSKPGYVLVHMAQAAVDPVPPPPGRVVQQMATRVASITGQTRRAGRLVRTWAAAHAELTVSEYAGRGASPEVKTVERSQAELDLFHAEVDKMVGEDEMVDLGTTRSTVRAFLDRLHEEILVAELDAQVDEWVGSEGSTEHSR